MANVTTQHVLSEICDQADSEATLAHFAARSLVWMVRVISVFLLVRSSEHQEMVRLYVLPRWERTRRMVQEANRPRRQMPVHDV